MTNIYNSHKCYTNHIKALVRKNPKQWFVLIQAVQFTSDPDFAIEVVFGEGYNLDELTRDVLQKFSGDYLHTQTLEGIINENNKHGENNISVGKALIHTLQKGNIPKGIIGQINKHLTMIMRYRNTTIGSLMGIHDSLEKVLEKALHNIRRRQVFSSGNDNNRQSQCPYKGESRNPVNPKIKFPEERPATEFIQW